MFVKTMKKAKKNYYYWAINERIDGKIKIKLYRRLTMLEGFNFEENGKVEPLEPIYDKNGNNVLLNEKSDYPSSSDKEIMHYLEKLATNEKDIKQLKSTNWSQLSELKILRENQAKSLEPSNQIQPLLKWVKDIESGKLKNTPSLRPKAFITKVLRPMLNL